MAEVPDLYLHHLLAIRQMLTELKADMIELDEVIGRLEGHCALLSRRMELRGGDIQRIKLH